MQYRCVRDIECLNLVWSDLGEHIVARIFLSYARADETQVRGVYRRLLDAGFEVWMDKINLLPGQRWEQEIPRAIRNSDFILIFFSKNSVARRGYIQREFRLALETLQEMPADAIHTIPIRLDDCQIPEQFGVFCISPRRGIFQKYVCSMTMKAIL